MAQAPEALKQRMAIHAPSLPTYQAMREEVMNYLASCQIWVPMKCSGTWRSTQCNRRFEARRARTFDTTKGGQNGKDDTFPGKKSWHVAKSSWSASGSAWKPWEKNRKGSEKSVKRPAAHGLLGMWKSRTLRCGVPHERRERKGFRKREKRIVYTVGFECHAGGVDGLDGVGG